MKKRGIKKKISYWFDNLMAKGTIVMLLVLAVIVLALVAVITLCICAGGWNEEEGFFYILWDVLATTINAWMPSSEDGGPQYVALIAISAIFGVLFTSFLIGIHKHCILVGFIEDNNGHPTTVLNPDISQKVCLSPADKLIVIGE